jgi:hypothetical protein
MLWTLAASADSNQPPPISDSDKQAASLSQSQVSEIDQAVAAVAKDLSDGSNPTSQSADRQWLIDQLSSATGASSPVYLQAYAKSVNDHLLDMVNAPHCDFRAALEGGMAAARIAVVSQDTELLPLATALMKSKTPAIVYIGMKVAHGLVPAILNKPALAQADTDLLNQILATVAANPDKPLGGAIAGQAYLAMTDATFGNNPGAQAQIVQVLVPLVMKLEQQRIGLYATTSPANPAVDSSGLVILISPNVWPQLPAAQTRDTMTLAANLIDATGKQAVAARAAPGQDAIPLIRQLRTDGNAFKIFCDPNQGIVNNNPQLFAAAQQLAQLGIGSSANSIGAAVADMIAAINAYKATL